MANTAVVFLTHVFADVVARRFERMWREASPVADVFLLVQADDKQMAARWEAFLASIGAQAAYAPFVASQLPAQLGLRYFGMRQVWSNTHFPLLYFSRSHKYDHYWQIEFDVEYRGSWRTFFEAYEGTDASLVGAHFLHWADCPEWFWWVSISAPDPYTPMEKLYKAFLPVFRISAAAIEDAIQAQRAGWMGHFEAVIPTVLLQNGHRLEDLNVRSTAYVGHSQDPTEILPLQSTIRCRPFVSLQEFRTRGSGPLVFHPVKENWTFDGKEIMVFNS